MFVFFVLVPPLPVLALLFALETVKIDISFMPFFPPVAVSPVLAVIPVVVVVVVGVVDSVVLPVSIFIVFIAILHRDYWLGIGQRS
jgi:hypothetical protein